MPPHVVRSLPFTFSPPWRVIAGRGWVRIALANGGQNALLSARSAACFGELLRPRADRGGHTRTKAVARSACSPRPPNELAAYRGQERTKWRGGGSGLLHFRAQHLGQPFRDLRHGDPPIRGSDGQGQAENVGERS